MGLRWISDRRLTSGVWGPLFDIRSRHGGFVVDKRRVHVFFSGFPQFLSSFFHSTNSPIIIHMLEPKLPKVWNKIKNSQHNFFLTFLDPLLLLQS